jgi:peptide/nickel transport system permease protein
MGHSMLSYRQFILKRLILFIPMFVLISFILWFVLFEIFKGDPLAPYVSPFYFLRATPEQILALRVKYGLNQPWIFRYLNYMKLVFSGDLGLNANGNEIYPILFEKLRISFPLIIISTLLSILLGIPLGVKSATTKNKKYEILSKMSYLSAYSIPAFVTGYIFRYFWFIIIYGTAEANNDYNLVRFATFVGTYTNGVFEMPSKIFFGLLDPTGVPVIDSFLSFDFFFFLDASLHLLVPSIIIGFSTIPYVVMLTRNSMKESLSQDYILLAKSKGLHEKRIYYKHALRNSISPLVSFIGILFGNLIIGTVTIEYAFAIHGIGYYLWESLVLFDASSLNAILIFLVFMYLIINLIIDITYGIIDPRVR